MEKHEGRKVENQMIAHRSALRLLVTHGPAHEQGWLGGHLLQSEGPGWVRAELDSHGRRQELVLPDTPAGRVLSAWLDAFNSGDRTQIEAYVQKHAAPDDSAEAMLGLHDQTGGFELLEIGNSEPRSIVYRVKERDNERRLIGRMVVSSADPPRVTSSFQRLAPRNATAASASFGIDAATRDRVTDVTIARLRDTYVLQDKAEAMIENLARRRAAATTRSLMATSSPCC